ncbi:hypothetical protein DFH07DRAFT_162242 [Mycena maculata]|uniref:F-box domain-containing protein n=1 Tax=Mycena maculata TaxID=230809 RepID=A0AAD7MS40_9AGAR|nr:hypothetical protein DFH07DRAFT_162242 [Mycena maculata]
MTMESPFKDILHTNAVPSDADCQTIRDFLVGPREEMAALTDEIAALRALLDERTSKRAVLDEFVAAHLALVSPVRRLPADIIRDIFVASLPSGQNSTIAEQDAPLLLCHICRAWRSLALSTPRLWASLHIVAPPNVRMISLNDTVNSWLSRSGVLPLAISVAVSPTSRHIPDISMLHTLIAFSLRWEHIKFTFPTYESLSPLASLSPTDVPILRTAAISCFSQHRAMTEWNNVGFLVTPSVHSACIGVKNAPLSSIPLRWERLRQLSFRGSGVSIPADLALDILQKCPLLETFSVAVTRGNAGTRCYMHHLQNLYVFNYNESDFFEHLVAPKLVCLQSMGYGFQVKCTPILSSSPPLESLSLSIVSTQSLLEALSLVPSLRRLLLSAEPLSRGKADPLFISSLNQAEAGAVICPNLEHIELLDFSQMSEQALLEFIQTRAKPGPTMPLSAARVCFARAKQIDIIPPLQPLISAGFKISLEYPPQGPAPAYSPSQARERNGADWAPFAGGKPW